MCEEIYLNQLRKYDESVEEKKIYHLSTMYNYLGDVYTKEYQFVDALRILDLIIELNTYNPLPYRKKIDVLIKLNEKEKALEYLNKLKKASFI